MHCCGLPLAAAPEVPHSEITAQIDEERQRGFVPFVRCLRFPEFREAKGQTGRKEERKVEFLQGRKQEAASSSNWMKSFAI